MLKIGIDVDDVLVPFLPQFIKFHNDTYGTNLKLKDCHTYKLGEILGISEEEAYPRVLKFDQTDYFFKTEPFTDAVKVVKELSKFCELYAVTSRPASLKEYTEKNLEQFFPGCFEKVLIGNYVPGVSETPKSELCKKHGINLLVDDQLKYAEQCVKIGIPTLLYDRNKTYHWNKGKPIKGVFRIYSWDSIKTAIEVFDRYKDEDKLIA